MANKRKKENLLDKIPTVSSKLKWDSGENGIVTLYIENKGIFNTIAQKLFKKPRISQIHLDEMGSYVWPLIDGKRDIFELGKDVKTHFGDKAEPLYERLAKYFQMLADYGFIKLN